MCTKSQKDSKIANFNVACLFARLMPVFWLKKRPSLARFFLQKLVMDEVLHILYISPDCFSKALTGLR